MANVNLETFTLAHACGVKIKHMILYASKFLLYRWYQVWMSYCSPNIIHIRAELLLRKARCYTLIY